MKKRYEISHSLLCLDCTFPKAKKMPNAQAIVKISEVNLSLRAQCANLLNLRNVLLIFLNILVKPYLLVSSIQLSPFRWDFPF